MHEFENAEFIVRFKDILEVTVFDKSTKESFKGSGYIAVAIKRICESSYSQETLRGAIRAIWRAEEVEAEIDDILSKEDVKNHIFSATGPTGTAKVFLMKKGDFKVLCQSVGKKPFSAAFSVEDAAVSFSKKWVGV